MTKVLLGTNDLENKCLTCIFIGVQKLINMDKQKSEKFTYNSYCNFIAI